MSSQSGFKIKTILTGWNTLVFKFGLIQDVSWGLKWPNVPLCIPSRVSWDQETYLSSNSHSFCPFKQQDVYPDFSTHPPPSAMIQRKYHTAIQIRDFLALSISEPNLNSGVVKAVRIGYNLAQSACFIRDVNEQSGIKSINRDLVVEIFLILQQKFLPLKFKVHFSFRINNIVEYSS